MRARAPPATRARGSRTDPVSVHSPFSHMCSMMMGLLAHPETLADPDGCRVPRVELGDDAVQPELAECEVEQQCGRTRARSRAPWKRRGHEPADLGRAIVDALQLEVHRPDERALVLAAAADRRLEVVVDASRAASATRRARAPPRPARASAPRRAGSGTPRDRTGSRRARRSRPAAADRGARARRRAGWKSQAGARVSEPGVWGGAPLGMAMDP